MYVVVSNHLGEADGRKLCGHSAIYDPHGALVVGDLNGDGRIDVATADQSADAVSVLLGRLDGSLEAAQDFPTGPGPSDVLVADFNADGVPDLATANYAGGGAAGSISVL